MTVPVGVTAPLLPALAPITAGPAVAVAVAVVFVVRPQCWPLLREGLALEAAPLLTRRPVRREETPQIIGAEPHAPALAPAAHFIGVRALAVARDAQRQAVALPTWFSRRHCRHKDKQKESAFLRAGEVEVKREIEKERKRTRDKEKERHREREKASRYTKRISAAKTGRKVPSEGCAPLADGM